MTPADITPISAIYGPGTTSFIEDTKALNPTDIILS